MTGGALAAVARRLRWSRNEVVASLDAIEPAVIARAFAYFFGLGATIVLGVAVLPGNQFVRPEAVLAAVGLAYAVAGLTLYLYGRAPRWYLMALPALGTALVSAVMLGVHPGGAPAYYLMNLWVVLSASYFFGLRVGTVHVGGIALGSGLVFIGNDVPHGEELWVVGTSAFLVTGVLLSLLRERADTLILQLDKAAHTDALTGLPNRRAFELRLEDELYRAQRTGRPLCLLAVDVDNFKAINDERGHPAGDMVLRRLAAHLGAGRRVDLCSRLGGDEFALLLPDTAPTGAAIAAGRLLLTHSLDVDGVHPRLSIGVASAPEHGATAEELQRAADCALYAAKAQGGHAVVTFEAHMLVSTP